MSERNASGVARTVTYQTVNPANGETVQKFDEIATADLELAIQQADSCFRAWRGFTFAGRSEIVLEAASLMESQVDELARLATLEMGSSTPRRRVRCC